MLCVRELREASESPAASCSELKIPGRLDAEARPSRLDQRLMHKLEAGNYCLNTPDPCITHAQTHRVQHKRTVGWHSILLPFHGQAHTIPPWSILFIYLFIGFPEHAFPGWTTVIVASKWSELDSNQKTYSGRMLAEKDPPKDLIQ